MVNTEFFEIITILILFGYNMHQSVLVLKSKKYLSRFLTNFIQSQGWSRIHSWSWSLMRKQQFWLRNTACKY
jgi:hypothetical protein